MFALDPNLGDGQITSAAATIGGVAVSNFRSDALFVTVKGNVS